jgi:hypothetical protein
LQLVPNVRKTAPTKGFLVDQGFDFARLPLGFLGKPSGRAERPLGFTMN